MLRRWRDLETEKREPYFGDPYECWWACYDAHGAAQAGALPRSLDLARVAARLDLRRLRPARRARGGADPRRTLRAAAGSPASYDRARVWRPSSAAKEAHVPVTLAHEGDELAASSVLIVPSADSSAARCGRRPGRSCRVAGRWCSPTAVATRIRRCARCSAWSSSATTARGTVWLPGGAARTLGDPRRSTRGSSCRASRSWAERGDRGRHRRGSPLAHANQYGQGKAVFLAAPLERAIAPATRRRPGAGAAAHGLRRWRARPAARSRSTATSPTRRSRSSRVRMTTCCSH